MLPPWASDGPTALPEITLGQLRHATDSLHDAQHPTGDSSEPLVPQAIYAAGQAIIRAIYDAAWYLGEKLGPR
jgi:hypothetical protein